MSETQWKPLPHFHHSHLNLRRNPFGEASTEERIPLAVANIEEIHQAANAMEEFVDVVKKGPEALADTTKSAALELANAGRSQCAHVQAFVGKNSAGLL